MKFEIKNRWTGNVQWSCELEAEVAGKSYGVQLGVAVKAAVKASADLRSADLSGADLRSAVLRSAVLRSADLRSAVLRSADLRSADLSGAVLSGADLRSAVLSESTVLPTGETWKVYRHEVVPALLTNSMEIEALVAESWHVHNWNGCPMSVRFHTKNPEGVPALLRPRAEQFIHFFDNGLLDDLPQEMGWMPKKTA